MSTSLSYDAADRQTTITDYGSGGSSLATYVYSYDYAYAYCSPCGGCYQSPASVIGLKQRIDLRMVPTRTVPSHQRLIACAPFAVGRFAA